MSEWKSKKLGDVTALMTKGIAPSYVEVEGENTAWVLNQKCNRDFVISYVDARLNDLSKKKVPAERFLKPGDVLINSTGTGTAGRVAQIYDIPAPTTIDGHMILLRPTDEIDPLYFGYVLKGYQYQIESFAEGSTGQTEVNKKRLADEIIVSYPVSLAEQRKLAEILGNIDEKIDVNKKINKNLGQQAQALFKAWFVDFEAFSGEMPNGWIFAKFGDIAEMSTSSFSPAKNPDAVVEHYSIPAFDEKKYPVFEVADGIKSNKYILSPNSVMISKLNPDTKRVWRPYCISSLAISSTEFIVFEAKNPAYRDFVYSIIDSAAFSNHMCAHTSGSTNSRQRTMPKTTLDFEFILPTEDVIRHFCEIVTPMYDLIQANVIENQRLAEARDGLLPKLMSGELDITEIDI